MPFVCYFRRSHYFIFICYCYMQSDKRDIAIPLSGIFAGAVSTSVFYLSSDRYCGCSATDTAGRRHCCFQLQNQLYGSTEIVRNTVVLQGLMMINHITEQINKMTQRERNFSPRV